MASWVSFDKTAPNEFDGVKIFSATMAQERDRLGDRVTDWIGADPAREIVDAVVTQSSDEAFHCVAITVFYRRLAEKS